ncbi:DUF2007 domain-containing protein [Dokdonella sp.]|uniref:putative signal transducing protein n=1 Tax=Dokdonella sp. TaxID=2291710 RepID=UPI0025BEA110|nr:DUF2007 domain-containing protein [Dokdonella sp.]
MTMQIVYRADTIIDANLVKGALEAEGIGAYVAGQYLVGAIGELPRWNLVNVMVSNSDVERALPIVREIETALAAPLASDAAGDREDPLPDGILPA